MSSLLTESQGKQFHLSGSITFVTPGAVMSVPMGLNEPPVICRRYFPDTVPMLDAEDGLKAQLAGAFQPVPWYSVQERDACVAYLCEDKWLDQLTRESLIAHIEQTPFYEWD